ncbi:MAG: molybdopterin-dependent oxidoreductase [Rubrivivax sp.]|jgi:hypothetical protein
MNPLFALSSSSLSSAGHHGGALRPPQASASQRCWLRWCAAGAGAWALAAPVAAQTPAAPAAAPAAKVVLSISGKVGKPTVDGRADFTMAQLAALPQHSFTTSTPWFKQPVKFTGPLLRDVLAAAGAQGTTLGAIALNNYKVDIPFEDAAQYPVIVARLMDDKPMPVREKGPLFIVYPFDSNAALKSERFFNRSAWQLRSIDVK